VINFKLELTAGRLILPPTMIAKKFDDEFESDDAELDFVLFLVGIEQEGRAYNRTASEFRKTWQRLKWDFAQE